MIFAFDGVTLFNIDVEELRSSSLTVGSYFETLSKVNVKAGGAGKTGRARDAPSNRRRLPPFPIRALAEQPARRRTCGAGTREQGACQKGKKSSRQNNASPAR